MMLRASTIRRPRHNQHRWLVSYADFVTLLFAFFVVMFAVARTSGIKSHKLAQSLQTKLTAEFAKTKTADVPIRREPQSPPAPTEQLTTAMTYLNKQLRDEIDNGHIKVHLEARGLVISLSQAAYFPSGGDQVDPSRYASIQKVADAVRSLPNSIRLEGHTDSQPLHHSRFEDNWALSAARALAMLHVLKERGQIDPSRLAIAGYGETLPIASNDSEEGRALNRRVEIVVLHPAGDPALQPR